MLWLICFFPSLCQVNELLLKYMKKIAFPFFAPEDAKASQEDVVVKSKLALGLTILTVVEDLKLPAFEKRDLADLCSLLCLDKMSQQAMLDEMNQIKKAFAAVTRYVCYWSTYKVTSWAGFAAHIAPCDKAIRDLAL